MSPNPRGGRREGAGRKRLAPDGMVAHNITLSAEDWQVIEALGRTTTANGKAKVNRSAGVRSLLDATATARLTAALRNIRDNAQGTLNGSLKTWTAWELDLVVRIADAALTPPPPSAST